MSTVLTNGIIIPDNGSRNWGGDLANNWNILDLNVGYMTDVKNRVTTLENSTVENTANIQTNASNISALQTSKQDALSEQQIANIADVTNKANDADVVHKSGNETVAGTKLFTIAPISANSATTNGFFIRNNAIARNEVPSQFYHSSFRVYDKNDHVFGEYCVEKSTSGFSLLNMNVRSENSDGTEISRGLFLTLSNDASVVSFRPSTNNEFNLGTSSNKWKTINGINPGALSLPDYSQSVTLSFAINSPIEIPFDGFITTSLNVSNNSYFLISVNDQKIYVGQSATKPTVSAFIPVSQNDLVKFQVLEGEYVGYGSVVLFKTKGAL